MRLDVEKLQQRVAKRRDVLVDEPTEKQVIVAWVAEPRLFRFFDDVELDDFTDFRCRAVVVAIRSLPNHAEDVHFEAIVQALERRDRERETHVAEKIFWWLADAICDGESAPAYERHSWILQTHLAWLRELNHRRRRLV